MSVKFTKTANRRPWDRQGILPLDILPQGSTLGSAKPRKSFYESDTIVDFVPGRQKARSRSCDFCGTPSTPNDSFCGWCGTQLAR